MPIKLLIEKLEADTTLDPSVLAAVIQSEYTAVVDLNL